MGGAVSRKVAGPTAFGHRDAAYLLNIAGGWAEASDDAANIAWTRAFWSAIRPSTDGAYVNFLGGDDARLLREAYEPEALPQWSFLWIDGPEGVKLPARLLEPRGVPEGALAPVVMYHYGGPGSQVVVDRWDGRGRDLWHKMMAQTGFGVLTVDNQASVFFGKAGEDRVHRRFGPINLAAQKAGVAFLGTLPWADPERIGLWGWSGGGSNTLYSMLNSPGTWRAGVSGAPVTDWRFYDTIWTERYLDRPQDNEEGYRASSPVTHAANLADALLVVHGTADDNVHPQNTIVLSNALIEAGKPFEQAIYPGQDHGFDGASERHFYERMTRFFGRELGGSLTPARPSAVIHGEETR